MRVKDFLTRSSDEIIGGICRRYSNQGAFDITPEQQFAWEKEVFFLKKHLAKLTQAGDWTILFEYKLPRINRWIDVVLLTEYHVIIIEFKVGESEFLSADLAQLVDYTHDIKDFHHKSHKLNTCSILCATKASQKSPLQKKGELSVYLTNSETIYDPIKKLHEEELLMTDSVSVPVPSDWHASDFRPTPTIVKAAKEMFAVSQSNSLGDVISLSAMFYAGAEQSKLKELNGFLVNVIEQASSKSERHLVFITGVPGSGKTLAGMSLVFHPKLIKGDLSYATFLSGNGPLVKVLQDAIGYDLKKLSSKDYRRAYRGAVQNIHTFINEEAIQKASRDVLDIENIIIFDEAQRAWTEEKMLKEKSSNGRGTRIKGGKVPQHLLASEPELLLKVMSKVRKFSVVVALVGSGQEINNGEGGLRCWGNSLANIKETWHVHAPSHLLFGCDGADTLFASNGDMPNRAVIERSNDLLYLNNSLRSLRSLNHHEWVNTLLKNDTKKAECLRNTDKKLEIYLTRDLNEAVEFVNARCDNSETSGLIANANAIFLRRLGIELSSGFRRAFDYAKWFNCRPGDARACKALNVVASQFECQGLDLDHTILVWGEDFLPALECENGMPHTDKYGWAYRRANGGSLIHCKQPEFKSNALNAYRVLLTRARKSMTIVVPNPPSPDIRGCDGMMEKFKLLHDMLSRSGIETLKLNVT